MRCHTPVGMNLEEPTFMSNLDRHPTSREGITCVVSTCRPMRNGPAARCTPRRAASFSSRARGCAGRATTVDGQDFRRAPSGGCAGGDERSAVPVCGTGRRRGRAGSRRHRHAAPGPRTAKVARPGRPQSRDRPRRRPVARREQHDAVRRAGPEVTAVHPTEGARPDPLTRPVGSLRRVDCSRA